MLYKILIASLILIDISYQECRKRRSAILCTQINQSGVYLQIGEVHDYNRYEYGDRFSVLTIKDSNVHVLPADFFQGFHFQRIYLEGIGISRITPGAFMNNNLDCDEIHLKDNHLKKISKGVFTTKLLIMLDLQHNELVEIEEDAFAGLDNLRKVLLNNNQLITVHSNMFDSMRSLQYLDISHNDVKELDGTVFYNNANLAFIYLNNNNLSNIPKNLFLNNKNITTIDISYNPIEEIDYNIFLKLRQLDNLNISFTERNVTFNLDKIELAHISKLSVDGKYINIFNNRNTNALLLSLSKNNLSCVNETMFQGYVYLEYLNLSRNSINVIDRKAFINLTALQTLDLSANKIQILPHGLFSTLVNLHYLNISYNVIKVLPYGIFDSLENLNFLDISSNEISSITPYTLHALQNLSELHLDDNNIEYLNGVEMTSQLKSLEIISLDNNEWSCSNLIKLVHILESKSVKVLHGTTSYSHNVNKIKCDDIATIDDNKNVTVASDIKENINNKSVNDKSHACKLVSSEDPESNEYSRLEIVLYLLFIASLLNLFFNVYRFIKKKQMKRIIINNDVDFENNTELV